MRCLACDAGKLEIINSRKHASEPRVWRRRKCPNCGLIFTTHEIPEYSGGFMLVAGTSSSKISKALASPKKKDLQPFSKASLLRDLFLAGSHMKQQDALIWLADTIASKAFREAATCSMPGQALLLPEVRFQALAIETLAAFDQLLAANYKARL